MDELVDVPLFDVPDVYVQPAYRETPSQSLRRRQAEAIAGGYHPLGVALDASIRLHPDVPRVTADRPGETALGLPIDSKHPRCGGCAHRQLSWWSARQYPKCNLPGRSSHGPGTDVRAWWPACTAWKANP